MAYVRIKNVYVWVDRSPLGSAAATPKQHKTAAWEALQICRKLYPWRVLLVLLALTAWSWANTPGKHVVVLNWAASATPDVTYNIYRSTSTGVCEGTPVPYATGISGTTFIDNNVDLGTTYFYNVSAVGNGGESACNGEVQIAVPTITTLSPTTLQGVVN